MIEDPELLKRYKAAHARGGLVRAIKSEVTELIAATYVYITAAYGHDRTAVFTVISTISMASYGADKPSCLGAFLISI